MELTDIIREYVSKENTDFSILINGNWGSGKTFFVKNSVAKTVSSIIYKSDDLKDSKELQKGVAHELVYVSLYGIDSILELRATVFRELNPFWKKGIGKIVGGLGGRVYDIFSGGASKDALKNAIDIFGGIPKNKVLVFDDLERLKGDLLNEVFGFINTFTEHQNLKVIIIADERHLKKELEPSYDDIKEKLIRFTFLYNPNLEDVYPNFYGKYKDSNYINFLKSYKSKICSLFKKGNHNNLRTMRFVIDLFETIFINLNFGDKWSEGYNKAILDRLFTFMITYSIEYKGGADKRDLESLSIISTQIDNFDFVKFESIYSGELDPYKNELLHDISDFNRTFILTFFEKDTYNFEYYPFLTSYIYSGDLSVSELESTKRRLSMQLKNIAEKPEEKALKSMEKYMELEDGELSEAYKKLLLHVKNGDYTYLRYPQIFHFLLNLSSLGLSDVVITSDTVSIFKTGMEKSITISKYTDGIDLYMPKRVNPIPFLTEIMVYCSEIHEKLRNEENSLLAKSISESLRNGDVNELNNFVNDERLRHKSIFNETISNPFDYFKSFIQLTNFKKFKVVEIFRSYLSFISYPNRNSPEKAFFEKFLSFISQEIQKNEQRVELSTIHAKNLGSVLIEILKRLSG